MIADIAILHWFATGFRESLAMLWLTWWPLVLGFTLAGLIQSLLPRDGLRARLGTTTPKSVAEASVLGVLSSSCSYAASATARALFARGSSWTNALVFMVASTNLVIELGVLLYLLLGWRFVVAQFVGGAIMVAVLGATAGAVFSVARQRQLRDRVLADTPPPSPSAPGSRRSRVVDRDRLIAAARYTTGDLRMLRRELLAGFLIAGFLAVHVPTAWWRDLFVSGHGFWTVAENVLLAPLVGVLAFVCSVGNIPLAATLWARGVAFGGVIAFIFADLVTLPLLAIYRRFYGTATAARLLALLWFTMSLAGLLVEVLFRSIGLAPTSHHVRALSGDFPLGATLVLNVLATIVLVAVWWLARRARADTSTATDPVCGMTVDVTSPAATREEDGATVFFCSPRCAERYDLAHVGRRPEVAGEAIDPVCGMTVTTAGALSATGPDGVTYYFCDHGCQRAFLSGLPPHEPTTRANARRDR